MGSFLLLQVARLGNSGVDVKNTTGDFSGDDIKKGNHGSGCPFVLLARCENYGRGMVADWSKLSNLIRQTGEPVLVRLEDSFILIL